MRLRALLLSAAFIAVVVPIARTEEKAALPDGNWILSVSGPIGDSAVCLLKTEMKDGKPTISVVAAPPKVEATVTGVKSDKGLTFTLKTVQTVDRNGKEQKFVNERVFVAAPGKDPKVIFGSIGTDQFASRARLTATEHEKLGTLLVRSPAADSMTKVQTLNFRPVQLKNQARQEKDADKKKDLRAQADEAQKEADEKSQGLLREVVAKHSDTPAALDAASALLGLSAKAKVTPEEATALTKLILKQAEQYGPRFAKPTTIRLAETLVRQKGLEAVALIPIEPIAKGLTEKDSLAFQFDTLNTYKSALEGAGKTAEVKSVGARLAKLDSALDKEWGETVPPFKPTAFAGRKDKEATRVTVLELFTGAQCGPCIAADVAFDALNKSYKSSDVILLQYHMHIPGPDPLTNADTVGRWDYYTEQYPYDPETGTGVGGTPTTIFNGKPLAGGGGGMTNAQNKFNEYRKILDPLLEKTTGVTISGTANRAGDKVSIAVEVKGVEKPENLKLRFLLVEDTVKYVGGNKIRFHHHVVRAMPGGVDGIAVKEGSMQHTATADIGAVRKELVKYLDEFAAKQPFPYPTIRPLDMKDLKVIAIVQNDKTREIVQAVQVDVEGKSGGE